MRVALYARVSTDAQEARGTIGSQLEVLRSAIANDGHQVVGEFVDNGYSGARLDRPGLDALRDAAEAGAVDAIWCLSPDRLARVYAYQVVILDELSRHGVPVHFTDAPPIDDDPQAKLLTQVQGVIAEYERAKIAERNRRGKLYRSRLGEVISWKTAYGYRRVPRTSERPAHLEIYEPEAIVVRRIFDDYVAGNYPMRQIIVRLAADGVLSPSSKNMWCISTVRNVLRNEAYVGRVYYNKTEYVQAIPGVRCAHYKQRPREEWIPIAVPSILSENIFEAAQRVSRDNSQWSPRHSEPGHWLLRRLVVCGSCGVKAHSHPTRDRQGGKSYRYYDCSNHDPVRAGGEHKRCREPNIRADELDTFVFEEVHNALLRPDVLHSGETALDVHRPAPDDEILATQLSRLDRKLRAADAERRRLTDLYQAGLVELPEMQQRAKDVAARRKQISDERTHLAVQSKELTANNALQRRITLHAGRIARAIDDLDFLQRQRLIRLVVEKVCVIGWKVEIHLRIPLDGEPDVPAGSASSPAKKVPIGLSSNVRLRSLRIRSQI